MTYDMETNSQVTAPLPRGIQDELALFGQTEECQKVKRIHADCPCPIDSDWTEDGYTTLRRLSDILES
jgi:hypothetical protein